MEPPTSGSPLGHQTQWRISPVQFWTPRPQTKFLHFSCIFTGRNEVVAKVMFLQVSVIHSVHGGGSGEPPRPGRTPSGPGRTPRDQADPPRPGGNPPMTKQTPRDQADPPDQGAPPWDQADPPADPPPGPGRNPT